MRSSAEPLVTPKNSLELTAHSAGFLGYSWRFPRWAAAQRERYLEHTPAMPMLANTQKGAVMHQIEQWEQRLEARANIPIVANNSDTTLLICVFIETESSLEFQVGGTSVKNTVVGDGVRTFFSLPPAHELRVGPPEKPARIRVAVLG